MTSATGDPPSLGFLGAPDRWAALFETALWSAPVGVAVFDPELRYVFVNDRLAEIDRVPAAQHVGQSPIDLLGELGQPIAEALGRVLASGLPVLDQPFVGPLAGAVGGPAAWSASYYPVRDGDGALFAIETIVADVPGAPDDRITFLSEAGVALAGSLEFDEVLTRVAELTVPALADWCAIDVRRDDGTIEQVAIAQRDPRRAARATRLRVNKGLDPNAPIGVAAVLRGGASELYPDVPDTMLRTVARDDEHLAALRNLGMKSVMVVPLVARGRTFGALTLTTSDSGRVYGPRDLALAEDLARRAALAVDNAGLYRRAQEEARVLEREIAARRRAEATARFLAEASTVLGSSLDVDETVAEVARLTIEHLADACAIDVADDHASRRVAVAPDDAPLAVWTDDVSTDRTTRVEEVDEMSVVVVPMTAGGDVIGATTFGRARRGAPFDSADIELAEELARRVAIAIENARLYAERTRVAQALQQSLLPPLLPAIPGMQVAARYRATGAGNLVGGDFYDVFQDGGGHWAVVVGDVAGIGAEAAAITGLARYTVRAVAMHEYRPSQVLRALNEAIVRQRPDERFCTAVYLRIEPQPDGARVVLSCGGHPPPLVVRANGEVEVLEAALGNLLGLFSEVHLTDAAARLRPGDGVVLYTDGVIEARRPDGSLFGQERLVELVRRNAGASADTMARRIESAVLADHPDRPSDDVAIVVLRVVR